MLMASIQNTDRCSAVDLLYPKFPGFGKSGLSGLGASLLAYRCQHVSLSCTISLLIAKIVMQLTSPWWLSGVRLIYSGLQAISSVQCILCSNELNEYGFPRVHAGVTLCSLFCMACIMCWMNIFRAPPLPRVLARRVGSRSISCVPWLLEVMPVGEERFCPGRSMISILL